MSTAVVAMLVVLLCGIVYVGNLHPPTCAFINRLLRNDIYKSVSKGQEIALWEENATAREELSIGYTNRYAVVIQFDGKYPPFFFKPRGIFQINYYQGDTLLREVRFENHQRPSPGMQGKCIYFMLDSFILPQSFRNAGHAVEVRVIEPDPALKEYGGHMKLQVRGDTTW